MQCPHDRLTAMKYTLQVLHTQEALIYPMKVNDVCLLKNTQLCYICTGTSYIYTPQPTTREAIGNENAKPLPNEVQPATPTACSTQCERVILRCFCNQHTNLHAMTPENTNKPTGGNCCTARLLRCIYYKDLHSS